jgi:hypothetical protein
VAGVEDGGGDVVVGERFAQAILGAAGGGLGVGQAEPVRHGGVLMRPRSPGGGPQLRLQVRNRPPPIPLKALLNYIAHASNPHGTAGDPHWSPATPAAEGGPTMAGGPGERSEPQKAFSAAGGGSAAVRSTINLDRTERAQRASEGDQADWALAGPTRVAT